MPGSALFNRASRMWLQTTAGLPLEQIGTGDFTQRGWYKLNAATNQNCGAWALGGNNDGKGGGTSAGGGLERPGRMHTDISTGLIRSPMWQGAQATTDDITSSVQASLSTWHLIHVTRKSSTKTVTLYLDGVQVAQVVTAANFDYSNGNGSGGTGRSIIGSVNAALATFQIDGLVTDVLLSSVCWTQAEITKDYTCRLKGDHPDQPGGRIVYWRLDATDSGGNQISTGTDIVDGDLGLANQGSLANSNLMVATGSGIIAPKWSTDAPWVAPTSDAGGPYMTCGTTPVQLAGIPTPCDDDCLWTSNGTGTFDDATNKNAQYTPSAADVLAGSRTLTFTVSSAYYPDATDTAPLNITTPPTSEAGGPYHSSAGDPVDLTSSAVTNAASQHWTTSGDGTFDNANLLHPRYTLGAADAISGCTLTLTATGNSPCGTAVDTALVVVDAPPGPPGPTTNSTMPQNRKYRGRYRIALPWR